MIDAHNLLGVHAPTPANDQSLRISPCTHSDAKAAVTSWHYSKSLPGTSADFGVWENGQFIGVVCFRNGSRFVGRPYGLAGHEVMDLCRVALAPGHKTPTSRVVSIAIKLLKKDRPGLRLLVSYADPAEGHHGGIYAGMNWTYTGPAQSEVEYLIDGKRVHRRNVYDQIGSSSLEVVLAHYPDAIPVRLPPKHKYVLALDEAMRAQLAPLAQPYPKRETQSSPRAGSIDSDVPADQAGEGGANPTSALSTKTCPVVSSNLR